MKKTVLFLLFAFSAYFATAQTPETSRIDSLEKRTQLLEKEVSKVKKFKVSGYIQGQYQWGQEDASLRVGASNSNLEESFNRIGIRRGRIKFTYQDAILSGVFQLDITEKGIGVKDAYFNVIDPWIGFMQLRAGIFDRPFGFEISHSSSVRESPERSLVFTTLFPEERDLGAMAVFQAPSTSPWSIVKLQAGLFAGNGVKQEIDNKRDFIGHLSVDKSFGNNFTFGAGASYYYGSVYQGTNNVYTMKEGGFELNTSELNKGAFARRQYIGFDAQFSVKSLLGRTTLRGEYIFGEQPGTMKSSKSPNASALPDVDTYIRNFGGGYVVFIHDIAKTPVSLIAKYDWYDPNTRIAGNSIGENFTGKTDIARSAFGFGAIWQINKSFRLQAYYDINRNETTAAVEDVKFDLKDNAFTLRLQYKF